MPKRLNPTPGRRWLARFLVLAYLALLWMTEAFGVVSGQPQSLWELHEVDRLLPLLKTLLVGGFLLAALFVPLGLLLATLLRLRRSATPAARREQHLDVDQLVEHVGQQLAGRYRMARRKRSKLAGVGRTLVGLGEWVLAFIKVASIAIAISFFTVLLIHRTVLPGPFELLHMLLAAVGCLLGVWIGWMWLGGWRSRMWLGVQSVAVVCVVGGGLLIAASQAVDSRPWDFEPVRVSSEEKRRLVKVVSQSDRPNGTRHLQLDEHDLNVLANWFLTLGPGDHRCQMDLGDAGHQVLVSLSIPSVHSSLRNWRYLNVRAQGQLTVRQGRLRLGVHRVTLGQLSLPRPIGQLVATLVQWSLPHDTDVQDALAEIRRLQANRHHLTLITYPKIDEDRDEGDRRSRKDILRGLVARMRGDEVQTDRVRAYVEHLVSLMETTSPEGCDATTYFSAAFQLAKQRSRDGTVVEENRAALLALAVLFGHRRVEDAIGDVTDGIPAAVGPHVKRATLRGRRDWTQHFLVSSAITVVSSNLISDALGLLKEELDAGGGSGFSFSDLLADRAGTRLARNATRNEASARQVQQLLSGPFSIDILIPPAADLPEGISAEQLERQYGGIEGQRYRQMIETIERRLDTCVVLRRTRG